MNEVVVAPGSAAIGAEHRGSAACPASIRSIRRGRRRRRGRSPPSSSSSGPEAPLAAGVVDALRDAGIRDVRADAGGGADRDVEGVLPRGRRGGGRAGWRAPGRSRRARERRRAPTWPSSAPTGSGVVLKQDGLAAGKGVAVYDDAGLALEHVAVVPRGSRAGPGARRRGAAARAARRASSRSATGATRSRCRRRATTSGCATATSGPNTGGMGAYSPLPDLPDDAVDGDPRDRPPPDPRRARPARDAVHRLPVRGADAHRRRAGAPRVQRPARRSRGAGDPAAARRRARAGARGGGGAAALAPASPTAACRCCPARRSASCSRRRATRARRSAACRSTGIEAAEARARSCSTAAPIGRPGGGYGTNGGRVLTVVGRGPDLPRARDAAEAAADRDLLGRACSAGTTSPRRSRRAPAVAVGAAS